MHRRVKDFETRFTGAFGAVHGYLCVTQQAFRIGTGGCAQGDANAGSDHYFLSIDEERSGPLLLDTLGYADGVAGLTNFFQKHGEFISTQSGQGVITGRRIIQTCSGDGVRLAKRRG